MNRAPIVLLRGSHYTPATIDDALAWLDQILDDRRRELGTALTLAVMEDEIDEDEIDATLDAAAMLDAEARAQFTRHLLQVISAP